MDPDPGGPKTCRTCRSGSSFGYGTPTLPLSISANSFKKYSGPYLLSQMCQNGKRSISFLCTYTFFSIFLFSTEGDVLSSMNPTGMDKRFWLDDKLCVTKLIYRLNYFTLFRPQSFLGYLEVTSRVILSVTGKLHQKTVQIYTILTSQLALWQSTLLLIKRL